MSTIKTKTIEVNSIRLSGKPVAYYDNSTKGGWDVTVVIDIGDGKTVRISCPLNKDKKPFFTEAEFKKGPVSFIDATFNSYIGKDSDRPNFQIKAGGPRTILLDTDIDINQAFVAGVVSYVNPTTKRFIVDIKHRKGLPQPGKPIEFGVRQVMVTCPEGIDLPTKDSEVVVVGKVDVSENKKIGILAGRITKIA